MYAKLQTAVVEALLVGSALASPTAFSKRQADLDSFITAQRNISLNGVLSNIGPDGSGAQGAAAGIVVASPSKSDPDCKMLLLFFVFA